MAWCSSSSLGGACALILESYCMRVVPAFLPFGCHTQLGMRLQCGFRLPGLQLFLPHRIRLAVAVCCRFVGVLQHMRWTGWGCLLSTEVACKLLVTWQLWCWAHWPCLPDHGFVVPEDDPHSFAAYDDSLLACMARIAYSVPHFYSLVRRLVFVRWQNAANLPPGYTCVRISAAKRADVGLSPGIWSHAKPSRFMVIS